MGLSTRKAALDLVMATILIIVLSGAFACVAVAIKLDSEGPVFFRQPRVGYCNRIFRVWKFRTMYHDASDVYGERLTVPDDPRITRVGALLRQWSIDEMPQLFNVLMGDMSFVGPRPTPSGQTWEGDFIVSLFTTTNAAIA